MDGRDDNANTGTSSNTPNPGQGIFSTPELTVDTEKIITPADSLPHDQSRIAALFTRANASRNTVQNQVTTLNTSDAADNNKKRLILPLVIIGLLVVIITTGLVYFLANNTDRPTHTIEGAESLAGAYNSYMNYLVYGTDSTKNFSFNDIEEYSVEHPYSLYAEAVIAGLNSNIDKGTYLEKLEEKYDTLASAYAAANDSNAIDPEINTYFYDYANATMITTDRLLQIYLSQNSEVAQQLIENTFNADGKSGDFLVYVTAQKALAELALEGIIVAAESGCIKSGSINQECLIANYDKINQDIIARANDAYSVVDVSTVNLRRAAMDALARIYYQLNENTATEGSVSA